MNMEFLDIMLLIVIVCGLLIVGIGFYGYYTQDKTICELYTEQNHTTIYYPSETVIINNQSVSLDYIKQSCLNQGK